MSLESVKEQKSYSKTFPFQACLKERYRLTGDRASKSTYHLEIDLSGSGILYNCGDSIAVLPSNPPQLVGEIISLLHSDPKLLVTDRNGETLSLRQFLTSKACLSGMQKKLLLALRDALPNGESGAEQRLTDLIENRTKCKEYLADRDLLDLLHDFPSAELDPTTVCSLLKPLMPRFYSIASSQKVVGEEVHLTVAPVLYEKRNRTYRGVATDWLCHQLEIGTGTIPLFLQQAHDFSLPQDDERPIIMVGPGTGVAPFRAFIQERLARGATGKSWLFFGERTEQEFLYGDLWKQVEKEHNFRLSCAFSRAQPEKIYVQQRMMEQSKQLFSWIEEGAHLYVCGDASRMAKDVNATLLQIIISEGGYSEEKAKEYLKALRKSGRYQRDIY